MSTHPVVAACCRHRGVTDSFAVQCEATATTFTVTATGIAAKKGMTSFVYAIDQAGTVHGFRPAGLVPHGRLLDHPPGRFLCLIFARCAPSSRRSRALRARRIPHQALVAILVVSIATTGVFTLIAGLVRASGDSRCGRRLQRSQRPPLRAWPPKAALTTRYNAPVGGFCRYPRRSAAPARRDFLANLPTISVTDGPSAGTRRVTVSVTWQSPTATTPHHTSMSTVVGP
jgi:hypothetical protein